MREIKSPLMQPELQRLDLIFCDCINQLTVVIAHCKSCVLKSSSMSDCSSSRGLMESGSCSARVITPSNANKIVSSSFTSRKSLSCSTEEVVAAKIRLCLPIDNSLEQNQACNMRPISPASRNLQRRPEHLLRDNVAQQNVIHHDSGTNNDSGFSSGGFSNYFDPADDYDRLAKAQHELMLCGFYFPALDQNRALRLLKRAKPGAFLIRDSAHPGYLYSVSVKSEQGATSVRVSYADGLFGFDGDEEQPKVKPRFESILALLDYYASVRHTDGKGFTMRGKSDRKPVKIVFTKPVRKPVPSLSHLSRLKINTLINKGDLCEYKISLSLLPCLKEEEKRCLKDYPYRI